MQLDCVLHVLDWCQWSKCHNTFVRGPREAPLYMSLYHSLYSNWEGFKDSSISADSGHERVGMMGGGGGRGAQL